MGIFDNVKLALVSLSFRFFSGAKKGKGREPENRIKTNIFTFFLFVFRFEKYVFLVFMFMSIEVYMLLRWWRDLNFCDLYMNKFNFRLIGSYDIHGCEVFIWSVTWCIKNVNQSKFVSEIWIFGITQWKLEFFVTEN